MLSANYDMLPSSDYKYRTMAETNVYGFTELILKAMSLEPNFKSDLFKMLRGYEFKCDLKVKRNDPFS